MKGKATWKPVGLTAKKWRSAPEVRTRKGKPTPGKKFQQSLRNKTIDGNWGSKKS